MVQKGISNGNSENQWNEEKELDLMTRLSDS